MSDYVIEVGDDSVPNVCFCCGSQSFVGHGFVYKNGDAFAVYYVGWSELHEVKRVNVALAIGEWTEGYTNRDRSCFGVDIYHTAKEFLFKVVNPESSPWAYTDLLGKMLSREDALTNSLIEEVFFVLELICKKHPAINAYLGNSTTFNHI